MKPAIPKPLKTEKELLQIAEKFYPSSEHLQKQWIDKTIYLYNTGKHAAFTGGFHINHI